MPQICSLIIQFLRGLGRADANRMKTKTLEISKTHTLAETYDIGNNALGNEEECALALAFEETVRYKYQHDDLVLFA